MKISVCAQSNNVNANVDSRFGRATFFAIYDDNSQQWEFLPNSQNLQSAQGAGIQAAQTIIDSEAEVLIASNVGPKAMAALKSNSILVFQADPAMTLEQAIDAYQNGNLAQLQGSNVEGHWV